MPALNPLNNLLCNPHPCIPSRCLSFRLGMGNQVPAVQRLGQLLGPGFVQMGRSFDIHYWCR